MPHDPSNLLLDFVPEKTRNLLLRQLEYVDLPLRAPIFGENQDPNYVHFLLTGIASRVTTMASGEAIEVGIIGHEGFPEKVHLLGPQCDGSRCFMQIEGSALRMDFSRFQALFLEHSDLRQAVHRYVQHDSLVLAQLGACNRIHEVEARLARWLLMVYDRLGTPEINLTQEFLGEMLGARRSSVNLASVSLQRANLISSSRGRILITNLAGLESAACECSTIVRQLFRSLYGQQNPR